MPTLSNSLMIGLDLEAGPGLLGAPAHQDSLGHDPGVGLGLVIGGHGGGELLDRQLHLQILELLLGRGQLLGQLPVGPALGAVVAEEGVVQDSARGGAPQGFGLGHPLEMKT